MKISLNELRINQSLLPSFLKNNHVAPKWDCPNMNKYVKNKKGLWAGNILTKIIYVAPIHIGQIIKNQSKIIF
jgi:hypothetical protein